MFADSTPLFEKEGNLEFLTLFPYLSHPRDIHRPRMWSAFAANNDPVDSVQIQGAHGADERFDTQESNLGGYDTKVVNAPTIVRVFDTDSQPHITRYDAVLQGR